jgi:hypothetical protein
VDVDWHLRFPSHWGKIGKVSNSWQQGWPACPQGKQRKTPSGARMQLVPEAKQVITEPALWPPQQG